jgi:lipopolysaccharide/colanic/teichoic acid biosynthesis glycosyltransferase
MKIMKKLNLFIKRVVDIFGSLIGLILLSPLLIVLFVIIKADSPGPAIFKQERLGKNGKTFLIFKFRTMIINAENMGDGIRVNSESDTRITKIGKFLRAASFDELPQLLNVLLGNMSLVGPRPPVTYHPYDGFDGYQTWAKKRFEMKPGITGLSQITVRNSVNWDERIALDNKYIEQFNLWLDIKILVKTVLCVIRPKNLYGAEFKGKEKNQRTP